MDELKLDLNHTYLLRYGCSDTVSSITILMITDKAYKVRWNGSGAETWELKRRIYADYSLVEDISDYLIPKQEDFKFEITYKDVNVKCHPYFLETENCKVCGGSGQVANFESTAGTKMCPACNGSGKQSKRIDILFE
jgi:DnaJ-class molecular chaperone